MRGSRGRSAATTASLHPRRGRLLRARIVFRGGPLFGHPSADALAVAADRIIAVGQSNQVDALITGQTRVVELRGRPLLPGFVDAHVHLEGYARARDELRLDSVRSTGQIAALVAERAATLPAGSWILGRGWLRDWLGRWPTAADLDVVSPRHPVALASHDVHALWANSLALHLAGIREDSADPAGGRIVRDESSGAPTGLLLEEAQAAVQRIVERPDPARRYSGLKAVVAEANRLGLTGAHDFEGETALSTFAALHERGELSLRVTMGTTAAALAREGQQSYYGADDSLRVRLLKLFADGALGSRTAYLLEPYQGSAERGIARQEVAEIAALVRRARARGLGVAVHAIGDAAVRRVLDAFEQTRRDPTPAARSQLLRVEHAQLVHPRDQHRFASLRVVASMQPNHCPADRPVADDQWGSRCANAYPWRSLLDQGAVLALGTDCPVEPLDPLYNLHAAVTRQDVDGEPPGGWHPEQRLTLEQAIRAYTLGSALASGDGMARGSLEVGKLADLVVLSEPVVDRPPEVLLRARVDLTVVGGQVVHEAV